MSGKRALLEQLLVDSGRHIFGNPGTTEHGFMDILQDYPTVQFMLALHEGVAVSMADAYARLTRRPAFVELHIAQSLRNAPGMMHNARIGKTPLVCEAPPTGGSRRTKSRALVNIEAVESRSSGVEAGEPQVAPVLPRHLANATRKVQDDLFRRRNHVRRFGGLKVRCSAIQLEGRLV